MALPTAQPAEVLRAWQKDDLYEKQLAELLSKLISSRYASKATPLSSVLYRSLTTLKDLQTLGEEYSGIVQVDDTYHKLPTYCSRLLSILLSIFGENITRQIIHSAEKRVEQSGTLTAEAQNILLVLLKTLSNIMPQIQNIHRGIAYINGRPMQIGKTLTGIDYVHVRPAAVAYYAHLRLLGIVTLLHAFVSCGQTLYKSKKHMDQMKETPNEVDSNRSCVACLEDILNPCVLPCGHIFCFNCCYGLLESCALCRSPFTKNIVVPLMNYYPE